MKKYLKILIVLVIIVALIIVIGFSVYNYNIGPVSRDKELKEIKIENGETFTSIASLLKENNLIKSEFFYKLYIKINKPETFEAGVYQLSENMGIKEIVKKISEGSDYNGEIITVTFVEGKNMRYIASVIAKNTINTEDDVFNLLEDKSYIDSLIEKYWFLTDDIKNSRIYYPLEGYLFPDTYEFLNRNISVEEIFEKMLDNMEIKLEPLRENIENSNYTIHEILTLSSIIELEASINDDRASAAGVIYNRLSNGMTLGIDATTYYGSKIDDWTEGLTMEQLNECNSYNTRGTCVSGLPVGPIGNPSINSIMAAINPEEHKYYYYVHDCTGKMYLDYTDSAQQRTINKLKNENNWCA